MILNPELRRNLWLEFSLQKLVVTPLVIGAILCLCYLTEKHSVDEAAYSIALFFLFLWGTKSASETIPNELHNHTWDYQRLSIMTPWTLSWGKLLGSTAFAWYGTFIALIPHTMITLQTEAPYLVFGKLIILLLGGLLAHSSALLMSMNGLQWEKNAKVNTIWYLVFGLCVAYWPTVHSLRTLSSYNVLNYDFYGWPISHFSFYFASLCLFLFWSIVGIYRNMRSGLQYATLPWVWFIFTIFCVIYVPAFFKMDLSHVKISKETITAHSILDVLLLLPRYIALGVASTLTYLALFSERINVITYKKIFHKDHHIKHFPRWVMSFLVTLAIGIWISFLPNLHFGDLHNDNIVFIPAVLSGAFILFLIRDILIIHYFKFSETIGNGTRSMVSAVFYLAILYFLIPGLLLSFKAPTWMLTFFLPSSAGNWIISLLAPALEILFMAGILKKQWHAQSV